MSLMMRLYPSSWRHPNPVPMYPSNATSIRNKSVVGKSCCKNIKNISFCTLNTKGRNILPFDHHAIFAEALQLHLHRKPVRIAQIICNRRVAVIELIAAKCSPEAGGHAAIVAIELITGAQGESFAK